MTNRPINNETGNGFDGGFGSGGGGGGGYCVLSNWTGFGGRGGPGLVIICWLTPS